MIHLSSAPVLSLSLITLSVSAAPNGNGGLTEQAVLTAATPADNDRFGASCALSGTTLAVSAPFDDEAALDAGAVHVFTQGGGGWSLEATVTRTGATIDEWLSAVALDGDTLVAGSAFTHQGSQAYAGAAYVFTRSGTAWSQQAALSHENPKSEDFFGGAVAVSGDRIAVGAGDDHAAGFDDLGTVTLFTRSGTTWTQEVRLKPSDPSDNSHFGVSLVLTDDLLVVGARGHRHLPNQGHGYVYVLRYDGTQWNEETHFTASNVTNGDFFGVSLSLSGTTLAVGAPWADNPFNGTTSGSVYVFENLGAAWTETAILSRPATYPITFGSSLALDSDTLVIGAPREPDVNGPGYVYRYDRTGSTWTLRGPTTAASPSQVSHFGTSVCASGSTVVVGATFTDVGTVFNAGTAHVLNLDEAHVAYCTAGTSASGCTAALTTSGTPSATGTAGFSLIASGVEGDKDGLFFLGSNGRQATPWGSSSSYQCVVPPVIRAGSLSGSGTTGACDGTFAQDLNALWCPSCLKPQKNPGASAVVQAQLWYRDPQNTSNQTTSLSNAVEFTVCP